MIVPTLRFDYLLKDDEPPLPFHVRFLRGYSGIRDDGAPYHVLICYDLEHKTDIGFFLSRISNLRDSTAERAVDDPHEFRTSTP